MACEHPQRVWESVELNEENKHVMLWKNTELEPITPGYSEERQGALYRHRDLGLFKLIMIPCGKCLGCKLDQAKEKAKRTTMECYGKTSFFITLTYRDEDIPYNIIFKETKNLMVSTLRKYHIRKMLNQIQTSYRKKGIAIKYIACGEYGDHTNRPHYHLVLINIPIIDLKLQPMEGVGKNTIIYHSKLIKHYWKYGDHQVSFNNASTSAYVAQYCLKKAKDIDYGAREPEFVIQSKNLGKDFILDNAEELKRTDNFLFGGHHSTIPKYADDILETPDGIKEKRQALAKAKIKLKLAQKPKMTYQQDIRDQEAYNKAIQIRAKLRNKV